MMYNSPHADGSLLQIYLLHLPQRRFAGCFVLRRSRYFSAYLIGSSNSSQLLKQDGFSSTICNANELPRLGLESTPHVVLKEDKRSIGVTRRATDLKVRFDTFQIGAFTVDSIGFPILSLLPKGNTTHFGSERYSIRRFLL